MNGPALLFVCTSNICRSPIAASVFRERAARAGLTGVIADAAGTSGGRAGELPDTRAAQVATRRGYALASCRARQVVARDFLRFDWILAMDERNLAALHARVPSGFAGHLGLLLDVVPELGIREVDDPYYGTLAGFERVVDLAEAASDALVAAIVRSRS